MAVTVSSAFKGVHIEPVSALAESRGEWKDSIPKEMAAKHPFMNCLEDENWIEMFAKEWYNAYFGDIVAEDQRFLDIISKGMSLACICSGKTLVPIWVHTGESNWYRYDIIRKGELCNPEQVQSAEMSNEYLANLKKTMTEQKITESFVYSTNASQKTFREIWLSWIAKSSQGNLRARMSLCNVIAYMAAVSLRALSKDDKQLGGGYLK